MLPETITVTGGINFEIVESKLKRDTMLWVHGKYAYFKNTKKGSRIYLRCRAKVICKGSAVVDCAKTPLELVECGPHVCGGSVNVPWAHFTEKKGKKKPFKTPEKKYNIQEIPRFNKLV